MIRKKTGFWTFIFSLIPGAGEMYLGFFKQGITLMFAFSLNIAVSAIAPVLSIFLPIVWFYSFFHTHNLASMPDEEFYTLEDSYFGSINLEQENLPQFIFSKKGTRIIGILLIILGCSALWDALRSILYRCMDENTYLEYVRPALDTLPNIVIGFVIIVVGIWLIAGKKKELLSGEAKQLEAAPKQEDTNA